MSEFSGLFDYRCPNRPLDLGPIGFSGFVIVINVLCEVCEDIELQFVGFRDFGYNGLTVLAIAFLAVGLNRFAASTAKVESKRVLPLLREAFRIDIVVPQHRRSYERLWHFAAC